MIKENPSLVIAQIADLYVRKNFEALQAYFRAENQLLNFQFFEKVFTAAETGAQIAHGLDFIPLDILVTHMSGDGDVTFQYGEFDGTNLILDATGACRVRFFAGTCQKFQSSVQTGSTEAQKFTSGL